MQDEVVVDRLVDGVYRITLNRPDALNAVTAAVVHGLNAALDAVEDDDGCRVVVLTGAGRAFCAGLDLRGYGTEDTADQKGAARYLLDRQSEISAVCQRVHALRQPVIAAVNGAAVGAGLALVLASDIRISAADAFFAVSFIRAGFSACDLGTSWLLPRIVGAGRAHELMLTGRRFGADEAQQFGLLAAVVPPSDLMRTSVEKAEEILSNAPLSVELTKVGMWAALETPSLALSIELENRQQVITAMTDDQSEAAASFLAKRRPHYRYR
ncbi:MAG TPA: enoyl-CoA hydratase/isomerase family protein [Acidimicrobiales bacterium]|nr:enoyl-CoA hydratase/isomerase family protein [Acidimicrobiales bacterium]